MTFLKALKHAIEEGVYKVFYHSAGKLLFEELLCQRLFDFVG